MVRVTTCLSSACGACEGGAGPFGATEVALLRASVARCIFLWLPRVERMAQNFLAFLLLSLFCASRGLSEGARRDGTIRLAQLNQFQEENHNCLLPLPLSWCYACCVCCVFRASRFGAFVSAYGSDLRVLRVPQALISSHPLSSAAFCFLLCLCHACTPIPCDTHAPVPNG